MDAVVVNGNLDTDGSRSAPSRAGYRRSSGSTRGEARRRELLDSVTEALLADAVREFTSAPVRA